MSCSAIRILHWALFAAWMIAFVFTLQDIHAFLLMINFSIVGLATYTLGYYTGSDDDEHFERVTQFVRNRLNI